MQITDTAGSHQFPAMQRLSISKGDEVYLSYIKATHIFFIFRPRVHYGVLDILATEFGGAEARAGAD